MTLRLHCLKLIDAMKKALILILSFFSALISLGQAKDSTTPKFNFNTQIGGKGVLFFTMEGYTFMTLSIKFNSSQDLTVSIFDQESKSCIYSVKTNNKSNFFDCETTNRFPKDFSISVTRAGGKYCYLCYSSEKTNIRGSIAELGWSGNDNIVRPCKDVLVTMIYNYYSPVIY